jgi:hypothetical protein
VVTKPTGNPPGRPRVAIRNHPLRFDLALAEAIRRECKVSAQKATELAVLELRAKKTDDAELDPRIARLHAKRGGEVVSYNISELPGDQNERIDLSKRIQEINTLEKMVRRGMVEADPEYFKKLAACFFAALFSKAGLEMRATGIELLSREIGEEAHFAAMVAKLREDNWQAMLQGLATRLQ